AELAQISTTASGAITFGDAAHTGTITFAAATPATTPGAGVVALQSATGPGAIVLDSTAGPALAAGRGDLRLAAGAGGIRAAGAGAAIASTGRVSLDTPGGVGAAANRVLFDAAQAPARVDVGSTSMPSNVYLAGLGDLTLGTVRTNGNAAIAVSAAGALTAAGPVSGGDVSLSAPAPTGTAAGSATAGH